MFERCVFLGIIPEGILMEKLTPFLMDLWLALSFKSFHYSLFIYNVISLLLSITTKHRYLVNSLE